MARHPCPSSERRSVFSSLLTASPLLPASHPSAYFNHDLHHQTTPSPISSTSPPAGLIQSRPLKLHITPIPFPFHPTPPLHCSQLAEHITHRRSCVCCHVPLHHRCPDLSRCRPRLASYNGNCTCDCETRLLSSSASFASTQSGTTAIMAGSRSMTSRTGRSNQRECRTLLSPALPRPAQTLITNPSAHRLWFAWRASCCWRCRPLRRQILRSPSPEHSTRRLGAPQRRLGD